MEKLAVNLPDSVIRSLAAALYPLPVTICSQFPFDLSFALGCLEHTSLTSLEGGAIYISLALIQLMWWSHTLTEPSSRLISPLILSKLDRGASRSMCDLFLCSLAEH